MPMTPVIKGALAGEKIVQYYCHSHDNKNLLRQSYEDVSEKVVPNGAVLTEYDTGKRFSYNKDTNTWVPISSRDSLVDTNNLLEQILDKLDDILQEVRSKE